MIDPEPKSYSISPHETDTYDQSVTEKELLTSEEIRAHWQLRAQRPDVQSVMSARHSLEENQAATKKLQEEVFEFLESIVEGQRVFELGVGIGRITGELAKRAKEVVGIDMTEGMLKRAQENLAQFDNVKLILGKIDDVVATPKSFDLVFESIVLLHILNPTELQVTIDKMKELSNKIFIVEHTYEGPGFPISKYTILRKPEEYIESFKPYRLVKQKFIKCAGDNFTLMLFENPETEPS